jgi:hypothetical protein
LLLSACGPISYLSTAEIQAPRVLAKAKIAGAEVHAPYEYWSAVLYLRMAKDTAAYANYQQAREYGRLAVELAERAHRISYRKAEPATPGSKRE